MKIFKYLILILVVAVTASCQKNEIAYDASTISGMAEFQLHFFVPIPTSTANNITKVLVNGQLYSNSKAPLATYNAVPSGAVGRFFTIQPGDVNLKLYQTAGVIPKDTVLFYNKNVTLTAGKQNVFVHDTSKVPVVFSNGYPYDGNVTGATDSTCWVKFYNFLYETPGVPTTLKIQYQYIFSRTGAAADTVRVNIGSPVAFGETTGWQPVKVVKLPTDLVSAGSRSIVFKIKIVNAAGNPGSDLKIIGSTGVYTSYTATNTMVIGRRYHHIEGGFRASTTAVSSVRIFTAL
jgi:hypothetical protein